MPGTRRAFIGGNWKMNTDAQSASKLAREVAQGLGASDAEVCVFPPFVYLRDVKSACGDAVILGSQDIYHEPNGAFTGEISSEMLADCGVSAVLLGHSERRHVIGEDDALINAKLKRVIAAGMTPVLCIGETIDQRESGETDAVNERQLRAGLEGISADDASRLVVAYEPVWAIGTGKTATPQDAQDAHAKCRGVLRDLYGNAFALSVRIIYGGSMKPGNAPELMAQDDIDGGLIGGASLKSEDFLQIVAAAG